MLGRFHWWVGMSLCTRWWLRNSPECQPRSPRGWRSSGPSARCSCLRGPVSRSESTIPALYRSYPGVTPTAKSSLAILAAARACLLSLLPNLRPTNGVINRYILIWECPRSMLSNNGLQLCSKLSHVAYKLVGVRKIGSSFYHPNGIGGVERVNDTRAQMMAMVVNERQNDWDAQF